MPELGAFVCEHKPAYFDSDSKIWYAPRQQVGFVAGRFPADDIIVRSISRRDGVTIRAAREIVANKVAGLLDSLTVDDKVAFPGFGEFFKSTSGTVAFRSYLNHQEYNKATGRYPIIMDNLWKIRKEYEDRSEDKEWNQEDLVDEPEAVDNVFAEKRGFKAFSLSLIKSAASLLLFITLALSFVVPTVMESKPIEANLNVKEEKVGGEKIENLTEPNVMAVVLPEADKVDIVDNDRKKYHLIVGTFKSEQEARKFISIKSDSNQNLHTLPTKTLCRVAYDSSDDFDALRNKLNSKEFREEYEGAWIWTNAALTRSKR